MVTAMGTADMDTDMGTVDMDPDMGTVVIGSSVAVRCIWYESMCQVC